MRNVVNHLHDESTQTTSLEVREAPAIRDQLRGNWYTHRAVCTCGYKGKWTGQGHAEDLLAAHRCNR